MKKTLIIALSFLSFQLFAQDMFTFAEGEVNSVSIANFWHELYKADQVNASSEPGSLTDELILLYKAAAMFNKHGYPDPKTLGPAKIGEDKFSETYMGPWLAWRHCYNREVLDLTAPMITTGIKLNLIQFDNEMTMGSYIETAYGFPLQYSKAVTASNLKPINSTLQFLNTKGDKVDLKALKVAIQDFLKYWNKIENLKTIESWVFKFMNMDLKYKIVQSKENQLILIKENVHGQTPIGMLTAKNDAYFLKAGPDEFFFKKVDGKMILTDKHGAEFVKAL